MGAYNEACLPIIIDLQCIKFNEFECKSKQGGRVEKKQFKRCAARVSRLDDISRIYKGIGHDGGEATGTGKGREFRKKTVGISRSFHPELRNWMLFASTSALQ